MEAEEAGRAPFKTSSIIRAHQCNQDFLLRSSAVLHARQRKRCSLDAARRPHAERCVAYAAVASDSSATSQAHQENECEAQMFLQHKYHASPPRRRARLRKGKSLKPGNALCTPHPPYSTIDICLSSPIRPVTPCFHLHTRELARAVHRRVSSSTSLSCFLAVLQHLQRL